MSRESAARFGGLSHSWWTGIAAAIALCLSAGTPALAQDSGITGRVISADTGEALGFTNVVFFRTDPGAGANANVSRGTIANADGSYKISAEPGTYKLAAQFIGYRKLEVTDIEVQAGQFTVIDFQLQIDAIELEEYKVVITAKELRNTDTAILAKRKKSAASTDGVSAQQIKESTDSDAAEAVNRVTGLSVVGGKYVYVRGLGERYSSAQLNGAQVGSPEANRRVLPLDIFPAGLLDNVVVQKTYTPDQPGEFGGGSVNISTLDFPSNETWSFSFKGGANASATGESAFNNYSGGDTDWLGFDDGTRDVPDLITDLANDELVKPPGSIISPGPFTADEVTAMGRAFNKTWSPTAKSGPPAVSFSGVYGNQLSLLGRDLGFVASVSSGNSANFYEHFDRAFIDGDPTVILKDDLNTVRSVQKTSLGTLLNGAYRLSKEHTVRFTGNYTRTSQDEVVQREGTIDNDETVRETRLRFIERGLLATTAGMDHTFQGLGGLDVKWRYEYSEAERDVPDQRSYRYELFDAGTPDAEYRLQGGPNSKQPNRVFEFMDDTDRNAKIDLTMPFKTAGRESKFQTGYAFKNKDRTSNTRRFVFRAPQTTDIDLSAPVEEILADENIGAIPFNGQYAMTEWTQASDGYEASHDIEAFYGMVDVPVTSRLRFVGGARFEDSKQEVITMHPLIRQALEQDGAEITPDVGTIEERDVLPSANLTYAVNGQTNIRGAFSRTLNRPDLRELSSGSWIDADRNRLFLGNPELDQADLTSYDLRIEWFPSSEELFAASAFYKDLGEPIEYAVQISTGSNDAIYQAVNAAEGSIQGVELEARMALGRLAQPTGLDFLNRFGVNGNVTLIDSNAELPPELGAQKDNERPLTGQSGYVVNAGAFFRSSGGASSSALQYNVFGRRIDAIGVLQTPNIWEEPRHSVDFTTTYRWRGAKMKFSLENILDSPVRYTQGGEETERRKLGRTIGLSIGYGQE